MVAILEIKDGEKFMRNGDVYALSRLDIEIHEIAVCLCIHIVFACRTAY